MTHPSQQNKYISPAVRIIAIVILTGFIVVSFAVTAVTIIHAGHNCVENLCSLCPCIPGKRLTEQVARVAVLVGILVALLYVMRNFGVWFSLSRKYPINLIEAGIRMNN
jgi:H+/Cl- antiporter ClcA